MSVDRKIESQLINRKIELRWSQSVKDGETYEKTSHEPVTRGKTLYSVCSRESEHDVNECHHPGGFRQDPSSSTWEVEF